MRSRVGFTLIELLVVLSILAALAAMAVPALRSAMDSADRTVCLSNLRQLGQGMAEFVRDHGHYPAAEREVRNPSGQVIERVRWYHALGPYVGSAEQGWSSGQGGSGVTLPSEDDRDARVFSDIFRCPGVEHWQVGRNGPYGYNHQYLGDARIVGQGPDGPVHRNYPVRPSQIHDRGNTIVLVDSAGTGTNPYRSHSRPDTRAIGNHAFTVDPRIIPSLAGDGFAPVRWASDGEIPDAEPAVRASLPAPRHQGGCCALYADGRAVWVPLADLVESDRLWNGTGRATVP